MAATWKTVRVFISSTFRDMHAERDYLVKVVFPQLREQLVKYRIHLDDIDLRWGVTREQAENNQVLGFCLKQIDECRPFFIGLLGERYGWVPQSYSAADQNEFPWIGEFADRSLTELEMLQSVLNDPAAFGSAMFFVRDPSFLSGVSEEACAQFTELPEEDETVTGQASVEDRRCKLRDLKNRILSLRPQLYVFNNYPCRWDPDARDPATGQPGRLVGLEDFGEAVRKQLKQVIFNEPSLQSHFAAVQQPTSDPFGLLRENDYHESFMSSRLRVYVGRQQLHRQLSQYVESDSELPCLLLGGPGSGKSAALAKFVADLRRQQTDALVIPHFVGASPSSTNLREMLRRICRLIQERFEFTEVAENEDGIEVDVPLVIPDDADELREAFLLVTESIPPGARVVLVMDAMDQLGEQYDAHALTWLPAFLPKGVSIIVSSSSADEVPEELRGQWSRRRWNRLDVSDLDDEERREILAQVPSISAKSLDQRQVQMLLENPATRNPLFLLVALEELRGFGSYEQLDARIARFPRSGDVIVALFQQVIERLMNDFNRRLVQDVLGWLAASRRGLSESELSQMASSGEDAETLFALLRQLRPYLLMRGELLGFYHRGLLEAVWRTVLRDADGRSGAHRFLAEYFTRQPSFTESIEKQRERADTAPPVPRPVIYRKADELLWQRIHAGDARELAESFSDLELLEAKVEAGLVFDLASEFGQAKAALPADDPRQDVLSILSEAVRRDIHFIARHPTTLFQCLWNSGWWYDTPEAEHHYRGGEESDHLRQLPPWERQGPRICRLLERWRDEKERRTPGFVWVRSLRPPRMHLDTPLEAVYRGHLDTVTGVAYAADGTRIASASRDGTIRVWDVETGFEVLFINVQLQNIAAVRFSADGSRIVGAAKGQQYAWNSTTGEPADATNELAFDPPQQRAALSPDGRLMVTFKSDTSSGKRGTIRTVFDAVRVWDRTTDQEICQLQGHELPVTCAAFSDEGRLVATGSYDKTVRVWDVKTGRQLRCFYGHLTVVQSVAISPDGRHIVAGGGKRYGIEDFTLQAWSLDVTSTMRTLSGHRTMINHLALSDDAAYVVSAAQEEDPIILWDAAGGQLLRDGFQWNSVVDHVTFTPDGRHVVGAAGEYVVVWQTQTGECNQRLRAHGSDQHSPVQRVGCLEDGQVILSEHKDQFMHDIVRLWNIRSGELLEVHHGRLEDFLDSRPTGEWIETRGPRLETAIADLRTKQTVGWFGTALNNLVFHRQSPLAAGSANNHLYLLALEGTLPRMYEPPREDPAVEDYEPENKANRDEGQENVESIAREETSKLIDKMVEGKEIQMDFVGDMISSILSAKPVRIGKPQSPTSEKDKQSD